MTRHQTHFSQQVKTVSIRQKNDYRNLINLSSNEFLYPELEQFITNWIKNITVDMVGKYPYYPTAEVAVANYFGIEQDCITLFPGADEAIRVLMCTLGNHKKLILSWPNYEAYEAYAHMTGLRIHFVDLTPEQSLESHVVQLTHELQSRSPSIFLITNPHPVTGEIYSDDALKKLEKACNIAGHLMVVDEAYSDFSQDNIRTYNREQNYLSIRSFSKFFGLAGLRLSAIIGTPTTVQQLRRWRSVNSISGLSLSFLEQLLANSDCVKFAILRMTETRRWFCARLSEIGIQYWNSKANFVLINLENLSKTENVLKKLGNRNIVVKTFSDDHPFSTCIRVTLTERKTMEMLLACL